MPNPIFNMLNGGSPAPAQPTNGGANGIAAMMQRFDQFRRTFSGNPRQQVQSLLSSGQMSQQQFQQLQQEANQLMQMLGGGRK